MRTRPIADGYSTIYHAGVFILILVLGLLMYGFALWAWRSPAELGAYDMLLRMRPAHAPRADMVIIAIDERTTAELGRLPWSRATHARIIRALRNTGAEVIAYDVLFPGPDAANPGADRQFYQEMTTERNVVLPMTYDPLRRPVWDPADIRGLLLLERHVLSERVAYHPETPTLRYYYFVPPWADFVDAAAGVGVAVTPMDDSPIARSARMAHLTEVTYPAPDRTLPDNLPEPDLINLTVALPGFPIAVTQAVLGVLDQPVEVVFGRRISLMANPETLLYIPIDRFGGMMIDYAGPTGRYPSYSAIDLVEGRLEEGVLTGATVFVGITDPAFQASMIRTPFGWMPRAEVTANAVATILNGSCIARTERGALATLLILSILLGLFLPLVSNLKLGPTALMLSLAYIVIAVLVLTIFRQALPVIPAILLILLGCIAAALLKPAMFLREPIASVDEEVE